MVRRALSVRQHQQKYTRAPASPTSPPAAHSAKPFRPTDENDDTSDESDADAEAKPSAFAKRGMSLAALHQEGFEPLLYNVWRQNAKTNEVSHFGNSEVRWVDNLLYRYTQPFD